MTDPPYRLPARKPESHKGDFGRALLIGGSRGMSGAIALAGTGALRSGAGLVTLAVADPCLETVAGFDPCYMTVPLACDGQGRISANARALLEPLVERATVVGVGPGLGRSPDLIVLVRWLYSSVPRPMVLDADALNALALDPHGLANPAGERVITPHLGEFRRLVEPGCDGRLDPELGRSTDVMSAAERAAELAARYEIVVVLKGHRTLVTDGKRVERNTTGNPGMATGGTGDVLTGITVALMCQGLPAFEAARLAVYLHGLAGDAAAEQLTQACVVASDLVRFLPEAFRAIER